ncbi:uncharacterized protein [Anoplolepis gracilipes]|uniref:uncharacterized protein isoform X2 n=1 Tax=Anoplolepis gracilipes TaxID=354296 RepID=UPI003B9E15D3
MLEENRNNLKLLKDKLEIDIIEKYFHIAKLFTITLMGICCCAIITYIILQSLLIFDIILSLNESYSYRFIFITEYFVNQEKYTYAIFLHHILAISVAIVALCSTGSTLFASAMNACALLNIASYRVENAIKWNILVIPSPTREYLLYRRLVHAVTLHRKAIEFTKYFSSEFAVSFLILIIVGVISLSLSLFQFLQVITLTNNIIELILFSFLILVHLVYMFITNYTGQVITDIGIKLFKATYNGLWYVAPLHTQKILLFILQNGTVNIHLTCGRLFTASLEGFAALVNMAVSYFIVIYSTRK